MLLSGESGTGPIDHGGAFAGETDHVSAIVDEFSAPEIILTMDSIADQLSRQGHQLEIFPERYRNYLELLEKVERAPNRPRGRAAGR